MKRDELRQAIKTVKATNDKAQLIAEIVKLTPPELCCHAKELGFLSIADLQAIIIQRLKRGQSGCNDTLYFL